MKAKLFKRLLVVSLLSLSTALVSCNDVEAKPGNINSNIVDFNDNKDDYFRNTIETIYNNLVDGGTTNDTVFSSLVTNIAKAEVNTFVTDEKIEEYCKENLLKIYC